MARQNRVTVACDVPVRRPSSAAEEWVTAAGSARISSPTFRSEPASRGSSVRISEVTSVGGIPLPGAVPFHGVPDLLGAAGCAAENVSATHQLAD